jgi:hypothetical protein
MNDYEDVYQCNLVLQKQLKDLEEQYDALLNQHLEALTILAKVENQVESIIELFGEQE